MIVLTFALCYVGFLALCLSMSRHRRDVLTRKLPSQWDAGLRGTGFALLLAAFCVAVVHSGAGIGAVLWTALLTAGAMLVALMLSYAPRQMPVLAAGLLPLALLFAVFE
jgi:hypothetical protein